MGAFLSIVYPDLYRAGRTVFEKIISDPSQVKEGEAVLEVLKLWMSSFSGYGIISNCKTPLHRDNNSQGAWFDLLTTIGPYSGSRLILQNLGLELQYESGTMVAVLGRIVRHGTTDCNGSRVCIAQYMRDNVLDRFGIDSPGFVTVSHYMTSMQLDLFSQLALQPS